MRKILPSLPDGREKTIYDDILTIPEKYSVLRVDKVGVMAYI